VVGSPQASIACAAAFTACRSPNALISNAPNPSCIAVLPSGVTLKYAAELDTAIKRPDRLAISYKRDLGAKGIWYDGATLAI
jgi:hypothetical protein